MEDNIVVRLVPFPPRVAALISVDEDEIINVYINARLSDEAQRDALAHELEHVRQDHIYKKDASLSLCEGEASAVNKISRVRGRRKAV